MALQQVVAVVLVVLVVSGAVGMASLLTRIMLPGLARRADDARERLSTRLLFVSGVLPLVGGALLARGAELTGSKAAEGLVMLVVVLPLLLAVLIGALAAIPYVGRQALQRSEDPTPLAAAIAGGVVVGFSLALWPLAPALALIVTLLLSGWWCGIGLGTLLPARSPAAPPPAASGGSGEGA